MFLCAYVVQIPMLLLTWIGKNINFNLMPKNPSPLTIVKVHVEQKTFNPDAVDTQIYCINTGVTTLLINLKGESFITIDEDSGAAASDSSKHPEFSLEPGAVRLIAEIEGWEWDGHVGMEIGFRAADNDKVTVASYDFKSSSGDYFIESLELSGRIINPL